MDQKTSAIQKIVAIAVAKIRNEDEVRVAGVDEDLLAEFR